VATANGTLGTAKCYERGPRTATAQQMDNEAELAVHYKYPRRNLELRTKATMLHVP